jgi:PAS domain S-box-containing protein
VQANTDKKALLLSEQVNMLFHAVPYSTVATVAGCLIAVYVYQGVVDPLRLYIWIILLLITSAVRLYQYARFSKLAPSFEQMGDWYERFRAASFVLAGVIGSAGFLLFAYDDITYQLVLSLMMVCIASFAITTMSPSTELVITFLLLMLCPLTASLFMAHATNQESAIWIMPVTLVMLCVSGYRISRNIQRNIELTIEAQRREQDLQQFQQRLALYFLETPLAVLEWNRDYVVERWNPAAERMFGYSSAEADGENLTTLLASTRSFDEISNLWSAMKANGGSLQVILENRRKNGTLLQCEWFNTPLINTAGKVMGVISLIQDVTKRMENERIKQEFVSIVSHELRTPVTSIKGSLALLTSGIMDDEPEKSKEMLEVALQNTNRLHLLINDILDVDKLESGQMDYRFTTVDLTRLVRQVATASDGLALQANVKLITEAPETCMANIDPDRVFQVITNIVANAIKFALPATEVSLLLRVQGDGQAQVSVRNFGEVIPEADRTGLFTKFFQRDSSATRAKGGTGLGLYICQKILAEHGSQLDFTSSHEGGTVFFFNLPLTNH